MRYLLIDKANVMVSQLLVWKYAFIPYVIPFIIFIFGYLFFKHNAKKFAEII